MGEEALPGCVAPCHSCLRRSGILVTAQPSLNKNDNSCGIGTASTTKLVVKDDSSLLQIDTHAHIEQLGHVMELCVSYRRYLLDSRLVTIQT